MANETVVVELERVDAEALIGAAEDWPGQDDWGLKPIADKLRAALASDSQGGEEDGPGASLRVIARVEDGRRYTFFVRLNRAQLTSEAMRLLDETHPTLTAYLPSAAGCMPEPVPTQPEQAGTVVPSLSAPPSAPAEVFAAGCPDCQPEQGGDGDWPEVWLADVVEAKRRDIMDRRDRLALCVKQPPADCGMPVRRYVPADPAPTQPEVELWNGVPEEMHDLHDPTQPSISDGDREQLEEIAGVVDNYAPESRAKDDAAFLRNLASRQEETWRAEDEAAHQQAIEAQLSAVQQPSLSEEDRRQLRALADRIASDIEEDWPHATEMRGYVRLLRHLASAPPGEARYSLEELGTVLTGDEMVRLRSAVASLASAPPEAKDFGPRQDEGGEGFRPDDPSDGDAIGEASPNTGTPPADAGAPARTSPDAEVQEGAERSRVGGPSASAPPEVSGEGGPCDPRVCAGPTSRWPYHADNCPNRGRTPEPSAQEEGRRWTIAICPECGSRHIWLYDAGLITPAPVHCQEGHGITTMEAVEVMPVQEHEATVERLTAERDAAGMQLTERDGYLLRRAEEAGRRATTAEVRANDLLARLSTYEDNEGLSRLEEARAELGRRHDEIKNLLARLEESQKRVEELDDCAEVYEDGEGEAGRRASRAGREIERLKEEIAHREQTIEDQDFRQQRLEARLEKVTKERNQALHERIGAEVERDANRADALANLDALETHRSARRRAEKALEEAAAEFERRGRIRGDGADAGGLINRREAVRGAQGAYESAAQLLREKQAALKGGPPNE